ncbi:putative CtpA-like serine protease [Saezia sanguinis]|uniref:Putative CtpA-like serine protease n=1 Tax=Saezia sanguinis TaxID=1965230 RepID=A0A433SA75_9BURK|nr:S41 family peptidase [Saezia sanguinis]RUS65631.1 putative CtpA-like serine protease [Saezia sanguinis]
MNPKFKIAGWITIGALTGALATIQLQAIARGTISPLPLEQIQEFAAVFGIIKTSYVEPTDEHKLMQDAISGMVAGLDPHSQYLGPEDFKEFRESTSGKFVGVGIEITQEDGLVKIVSPIEGSPAYRAGIQSGDLITRIDDTEVRGLTLQQAVQRMRGEPNTKVVLTIFRKSENRTFTVPIIRAEIQTQSVKARIIEPGYGWIRVSQFQDNTVAAFVTKINELYQQDPNLKGLVLDLRNDPGGLLDAAVAISSAFLPENTVVVSTNGQLEESKYTFKSDPQYYVRLSPLEMAGRSRNQTLQLMAQRDPLRALPEGIKTVPLVILVNEGSASASEIVAGALQDNKRATVMGAQTFGKGSVQTIRPLSENTGIKLTTALYYTPSGSSIQAKGIVPDILLAENEDGSSPLAALYTREADLLRHLTVNEEDAKAAAERRANRDAAINRLQNGSDDKTALPRPPEYGSDEDFRLRQALNFLQGKPVIIAQADESKADSETDKPAASSSDAEKPEAAPGITERVLPLEPVTPEPAPAQ